MFLATQRIQTRSSISDVDNNQRDLTAVIANILPIEWLTWNYSRSRALENYFSANLQTGCHFSVKTRALSAEW